MVPGHKATQADQYTGLRPYKGVTCSIGPWALTRPLGKLYKGLVACKLAEVDLKAP